MGKKKSDDPSVGNNLPKKGDSYCCDSCGMELVITVDCGCSTDDGECPCFQCCGAEMSKK